MNALELVTAAAEIVLLAILVPVVLRAVQDRARGAIDIAVFFGLLDALLLRNVLGLANAPVVGVVTAALAYALPYLMLRLLSDFGTVPRLVLRGTEVAFVALVVTAFVYQGPDVPPLATVVRTLYFVGLFAYTSAAFVRLARETRGITRRRMQAVSIGNALFALVIAAAGLLAVFPALAVPSAVVVGPGILATSIAWFAGFAPPHTLRRFWQERELRAFVARTAALSRLGETRTLVREVVDAAADTTGAQVAVGLWDESAQLMRFRDADGRGYEFAPRRFLAWTAFAERRAHYTEDPSHADPDNAAIYRERKIGAVLSAPMVAGDRALGVLIVYASGALIFPRGDLELAQLLADQAAVVIESHRLVAEASQTQAREEAARLREEFLSAAAHDLKTPLTALVGRAQLLQRQLQHGLAVDPNAVDRIVADGKRLTTITEALLDAARIGQGRLELRREPVDLGALVRELSARRPDWTRVHVITDGDASGALDRALIEQVLDNLVGNALKYSDAERPVVATVTREGPDAHLVVRDEGIGIPTAELSLVFERFRRGSNVSDRHIAGIGLGLFICRGIVDGHGGRIWAESEPGRWTAMHVTLPLTSRPDEPAPIVPGTAP